MIADYKGISLFNDVDDAMLRENNRATVMVNMFEDNMGESKRVSPKVLAQILGYFNNLPKEDRKGVFSKFSAEIAKRGIAVLH